MQISNLFEFFKGIQCVVSPANVFYQKFNSLYISFMFYEQHICCRWRLLGKFFGIFNDYFVFGIFYIDRVLGRLNLQTFLSFSYYFSFTYKSKSSMGIILMDGLRSH